MKGGVVIRMGRGKKHMAIHCYVRYKISELEVDKGGDQNTLIHSYSSFFSPGFYLNYRFCLNSS